MEILLELLLSDSGFKDCSPICILKFWHLLPWPAVQPEVGRDIGTRSAALRPAPFRQPREDVEVEGGPGEADGLPAEGAGGGLAADVLEALPAEGVPVAADEGRQSPVPVVLVRADRALLGPSQEAAPFHLFVLLRYYINPTGKTPKKIF